MDIPGELLVPDELEHLKAPTALERARAVRDVAERIRPSGVDLPGTGTTFRQLAAGHGYLLSRTSAPYGTVEPTGFVVGGNLTAADDPAEILAQHLRQAWSRVHHPDQFVLDRIRALERHFGVLVLPPDLEISAPVHIESVLFPGARVCFSGTVDAPGRGLLTKEDLHAIAAGAGLVPVPMLTKTRSDVLVVADVGSQSLKARSAARWGKPVVAATEFLAWAGHV